MESSDASELPVKRGEARGSSNMIGVHVLSEHMFCPRAAVLALESGEDEGDEEPRLGPPLDRFVDYDEHRFVEELHAAWGRLRFWLTLMAPAVLLAVVVWRFTLPVWGMVVSLPAFCIAAAIKEMLVRIVNLVREQAEFKKAEAVTIDLPPDKISNINWWSLRKAGFDCLKPAEAYRGFAEGIKGKPWRLLTKDTVRRIPVVRKHRGSDRWGPQHVTRVAAYCRLIKACEHADASFGVLMFAGSYECLVIPNDSAAQSQLDRALRDAQEFLRVWESGQFTPVAPTDNRCTGCHQGKPRKYRAGKTETVLNGRTLDPMRSKANNGQYYHCTCGDRFRDEVPPHENAIALGIAKKPENA